MAAREWAVLPFSEAVLINPRVPLERGVTYPFVDMQAVDPNSRSVHASLEREFTGGGSRFAAGDTLMARITPCLENGKVARFTADSKDAVGHGSTEFIVVRGRPGVTDTGFVYYLTRWDGVRLYAISQMTGTSGRQRVPIESLRHLEVDVPSLPEQRAIAHILGTLDDKIELNRRMNKTLEAMARAIFKSWFVDFDPVRAKADGRQPVGMDPATASLFPDAFEDSPLGKVPEGWAASPMSEVVEINPRRSLKKGTVAPYLDMKGMPTRGHRPDSWTMRALGSGTKFRNGDTLMARITPCLENGKTAFVDFLDEGEVGWGSTEFIVLRPRPPLPLEYGYYLARSDDVRTHAILNMTGSSGRQRVPPECLDHLLIPVPPAGVAKRFGELVQPLMAMITSNCEQSATLASIRDALLPKLLSGEIRVPDAEKCLESRT